ncbi:ABC transporter ATP-binding protein [Sulfitobacter sp.]|uniref:ABC transporter ATP-binding protein n=1 Tax=Sulfitobacter sp. TaxID=1903071 RepID=UPI003001A543
MNALELKGVSKRFGDTQALDNIDLVVEQGSLVVLLGPTGAGKTTLQRVVAGLEKPDAGQVLINGREMGTLQPNQRDVSVVFESLALYPNLSAFENMAHPLRIRGASESEIKQEVGKFAEILHVSHILDRKPASFSGGEKQRIAIGRALIKPSAIYLLDEPLSSLDAVLRTGLRSELKRLLKESGHSFIFATPDYTEALALGDNVNVMLAGKIVQSGSAVDLYTHPANSEIATFVGNPPMNLMSAKIKKTASGATAQVGSLTIDIKTPLPDGADQTGVVIGIRPEDLHVNCGDDAFTLISRITDQEPLGNRATLLLIAQDVPIAASVDASHNFEDVAEVRLGIDPQYFHYFSADGMRLT